MKAFYSIVWLINLKDNSNQYYSDKPFEVHSKRQYYWMRIKEQYIYCKTYDVHILHYPKAADPRLGCLRILWMCNIQVILLEGCK
jgi:hypothetical protein